MHTPHKHAEVIKLWADGAQIQYKDAGMDTWRDMQPYSWPGWFSVTQYRVKPETIRYRVALLGGGRITPVTTDTFAIVVQNSPRFKRWLTEWAVEEI